MSEEEQQPEQPKSKALMEALYDAAAAEDTTPVETPSPEPMEARTLGEILRRSEAGQLPDPEEAAPEEAKVQPEPESPKVGQREVPLVPQQQPQQVIQQVVQQVPAPAPSPAPAPVDPEEGLLPEQKERLRLARLAGQLYKEIPGNAPVEYKDVYDRYLNFYQKESEYVQKQLSSGENLEWDDSYKELKETLDPKVSDTLVRKLEREDIKRDLSADLRSQKQEIAALKHQLHQQTATPVVEQTLSDYHEENYKHSVPEDIREQMEKQGDDFAAARPFEHEIIDRTLRNVNRYMSQFERVNNGLERYDSQKHGRLASRIETLGQAHKKKARSRDGKTFVTRAEFAKLPQQQRGNHYTWGAEEVKKAFMAASKSTIETKLAEVQEKVSKYAPGAEPRQQKPAVEPTPKTATPRTPSPSVSENQGEEVKSTLASMLLD